MSRLPATFGPMCYVAGQTVWRFLPLRRNFPLWVGFTLNRAENDLELICNRQIVTTSVASPSHDKKRGLRFSGWHHPRSIGNRLLNGLLAYAYAET